MNCEKCHQELGMKDLVHRFRVWCSPTSPGAKGHSYWFDSIDEATFILNVCPLWDFGTLLALDLIVCTGKVGPTCSFGARFVGLVVMA